MRCSGPLLRFSIVVSVETADGVACLENDAVIVCAGGVLPNDFLESFGVQMSTAHGKAM